MKKTTKIILVSIIIALLLIGIGYAAIQNITLNIFGTATANPEQESFKVMFTEVKEVSDSDKVVAGITDDTNATIGVTGLTQKGQTVSATYIIKNASEDLSADLSIATTNDNTEYFVVSSKLEETSIKAGEETTVEVTVKLTKTPVTDEDEQNATATIGVELIAMPVQPGQEGTSENINGVSQTPSTLSLVENTNIGDYIDLGNNIIGTESTTDD